MDKFAESLSEYGYKPQDRFSNWMEAFDCLKEVIKASKDAKKVIFIDELSWMDTRDSGLINALESFWNGWVTARREKDVILIVCASATCWMIDNVVNAKGGLHNRLTGQVHLKPFTLGECKAYLESRNIVFSVHQILQCYMVLGGVPYYWSLLKKGMSLAQNIDSLFFQENGMLSNEFENLYRALFNRPEKYLAIVEALSAQNRGLSRDEILQKTGISGSGDFSRKLRELENCGFVRRYVPFGYKERNCIYQLIDNYTIFYFKFLKDRKYDDHFWENHINTPQLSAWCGVAFERVCLEHVPQIKKALGISGVSTEVNSWQCKADPENGIVGSQIDLLIVRRDQIINMCEMKYSESGFIMDSAFERSMKRKIEDFKKKTGTRYAIHETLVTTYELDENAYNGDLQAVITAEDLFQ